MVLSEEQINIIAAHPLNDSLVRFAAKLRNFKGSKEAWRADVSSLLLALVGSKAAFNLRPSDGDSNVATKLFPVQQNVQGSSLTFSHFRPLVDAVVAKSSEANIWTAVINLIDAVNPSTPPPTSIVPTAFGTPVRRSSSRLADSETRDIVERDW